MNPKKPKEMSRKKVIGKRKTTRTGGKAQMSKKTACSGKMKQFTPTKGRVSNVVSGHHPPNSMTCILIHPGSPQTGNPYGCHKLADWWPSGLCDSGVCCEDTTTFYLLDYILYWMQAGDNALLPALCKNVIAL